MSRMALPSCQAALLLMGMAVALGGCSAGPQLEGTWKKEDLGAASQFVFDGKRASWQVDAMGVSVNLAGDATYDERRGVLKVTGIRIDTGAFPIPLGVEDVNQALKSRGGRQIPEEAEFRVAFKNSDRMILRAEEMSIIPVGAYSRAKEEGQ